MAQQKNQGRDGKKSKHADDDNSKGNSKPKVVVAKVKGPTPDYTPAAKRASMQVSLIDKRWVASVTEAMHAYDRALTGMEGYQTLLTNVGVPNITFGLKVSKEVGNKSLFGEMILEIYTINDGTVVFGVLESSFPPVDDFTSFYLPKHWLNYDTVQDVSQGERCLMWQREVHAAIRSFLRDQTFKNERKQAQATRPVGKKEARKLETRRLQKQYEADARSRQALIDANARAAKATALIHMKKHAISFIDAANGKQGYVDLTDNESELIILFSQIGADKVINIEHMSSTHMLSLVNCKVGTQVYAGQVIRGHIDNFEAQSMSNEEKVAKDALIAFIRNKMSAAGMTFRTGKPHQYMRPMKQAA